MDGREFIRRSPSLVWTDPFEAYTSPTQIKKREKEARKRREQGLSRPTMTSNSSESSPEPQLVEHYLMNLPDSALEFLDAFIGLYDPMLCTPGFVQALEKKGMPVIHAYCFTREIESDKAEIDICEVSVSSCCFLNKADVRRSEHLAIWDIPSLLQ